MIDIDRRETVHTLQRKPCTVSHVADFNRRYPGDHVTLYSRVHVHEPLSGLTLRVTLPEGLVPGLTRAPDDIVPQVALGENVRHLIWNIAGEIEADTSFEYQVETCIAPARQDLVLRSCATVTVEGASGEPVVADAESVAISVSAKAKYLNYMPALYDKDELMGRFLMLFESFWMPIEGQINNLPLYFDPSMTPSEFLPWLASWFNLVLDARWPEERRRQLLRSAVSLYRKRGTKQGLQEYLELFTGERPEIIEHRANNFVLGGQCQLGPGIALGTKNVPHTFTVTLRLPSISARGEDETFQEAERRRIIEAIIEEERPAHTSYTLQIETMQPVHRTSQPNDQPSDHTEGK